VLTDLTTEEHVVRVLRDLQERVRGGATFSRRWRRRTASSRSSTSTWSAPARPAAPWIRCWPPGRLPGAQRGAARHRHLGAGLPEHPAGRRRPVGDHAAGVRRAPVHRAVRGHGRRLPLPTRIVVGAGDLVRGWWWALLVVVAVVAVLMERWLQDPDNRRRFDYRVMRCRCSAT
jgi:general secretion pathway protein F